MAVDVLLRPTNILAFLPVAVALGLSLRRWALLSAGGLPGALLFALHNFAAYGSWFATGYGDNRIDFAFAAAPLTLAYYVRWLPVLLSPVVVFVLWLPWSRSERLRTRWALGVWIAAFLAFYLFYKATHEVWWNLRFLLPAAPAMVIGGVLALRDALSRVPRIAAKLLSPMGFGLAVAFVIANSVWWARDFHILSVPAGESRYQQVAAWLNSHLPKDAVCLAMQDSGSLLYYTDFVVVRWDAVRSSEVNKVETAVYHSGRPLYAVLFPFEVADRRILDWRFPGGWRKVGAVADVTIWERSFDKR
jgi:hypothetical protein